MNNANEALQDAIIALGEASDYLYHCPPHAIASAERYYERCQLALRAAELELTNEEG